MRSFYQVLFNNNKKKVFTTVYFTAYRNTLRKGRAGFHKRNVYAQVYIFLTKLKEF